MPKYCHTCGKPVKVEDAKFCHECGAPFNEKTNEELKIDKKGSYVNSKKDINFENESEPQKRVDLIESICFELLKSNDTENAKQLISEWPFKPSTTESKRYSISKSDQIEVFNRDHFTCQYCGKRTIFPPTLRVISILLKKDFPYQPHWKWNETHPAYWVLAASCDHKKPVSHGGTKDSDKPLGNLVTTCYMCNSIKANWTLDDLGWKIHEPVDHEWDGLVNIFIDLMKNNEQIEDKSLKRWLSIVKEKPEFK